MNKKQVILREKLLVVLLIFVLIMSAGCQKEEKKSESSKSESTDKKITIGFSTLDYTDVFAMTSTNRFVDLAESKGIKVILADGNANVETQLNQFDNFIAQDVDLIVVMSADGDGIIPGVKAANKAGISVVTYASSANGGESYYVGTNGYNAGELQAELTAELLPQNGKILYLQGTTGIQQAKLRYDGFFETLDSLRDDYELLDSQDGDWLRTEGQRITEDWIQAYSQIDAIICANDQMALGAVESLKEAKRLDGVIIMGVDGTNDAFTAIQNDEMTMSTLSDSNDMASTLLDVCYKLLDGEEVPEETIVPFIPVTKDNVEEYIGVND